MSKKDQQGEIREELTGTDESDSDSRDQPSGDDETELAVVGDLQNYSDHIDETTCWAWNR